MVTELLCENIFFPFLGRCNFLDCIMSSIGCTELFFFAEESGNADDVKVVCLYLMRGNLIKACAIFGWFNRFDRFYGYFSSLWMSWFLY